VLDKVFLDYPHNTNKEKDINTHIFAFLLQNELILMNEEAILLAIKELENWEKREKYLKKEMKLMSKEERKLRTPELEKIREQIYHYKKLIKEMKTEIAPPKTGNLLERISK